MRAVTLNALFVLGFSTGVPRAEEIAIPKPAAEVLENYCIDCHDKGLKKGGLNLDVASIDWSQPESRELWGRVHRYSHDQLMPPPKKDQPTAKEREVVWAWLDESLMKHSPIGGTPPRRLNQQEYQNTIRQLFHLPDFELPAGFPDDPEYHGFNNVGHGLVTSPPLIEAYAKVATSVADELFPPKRKAPSVVRKAGPEDMVVTCSASSVRGDALRLASSCETAMRSCTWPSRIEITHSGVYRITVSASTFKPKNDQPMELEIRARELTASDKTRVSEFRLLKNLSFDKESPESATFEAELHEGQTLIFRWTNAEMNHDAKPLHDQMKAWFEKDKRFLAAWQKAVFPKGDLSKPVLTALRGRYGWKVINGHWQDPKLDLKKATMKDPMTVKLLQYFNSNEGTYNLADALCHYYFENGPSLELHAVEVEGPLSSVEGPREKRSAAILKRVAGVDREGLSDDAYARKLLENFLPRAFRRPVDEETRERFLAIATTHWKEGRSTDEGLHLMIRNILVSPRFLYRCVEPGEMDDHDLATRLAYFLTQAPPDARLIDLANRKRLSEDWVLEGEARRLMPMRVDDPFVKSFTGQWLDTILLPEIMPDPKFNFTPYHVDIARSEIEHSFVEILSKNRPLTDFIDPDFTFLSPLFAKEIYGLDVEGFKGAKLTGEEGRKLRRIPLERGQRVGGLLGQSGIMMATANGVDTQPVLRGVWVLENILGSPPPPAPKDVPALTPDTRDTKTPRDLLAAHTQSESCATCHRSIDPVGFVLENYDPVGRWRTKWPKGAKIDPTGVLPDGTPIKDVVALKKWLANDIDPFAECLAEKLMIYATGRVPNYREKKVIAEVVRKNHANGNGFQSLVIALIRSEVFRSK